MWNITQCLWREHSESARRGLHVGRSENMAAVVRLLPSIRPQMASLIPPPPPLISQHALRGQHLETKSIAKKKKTLSEEVFFAFLLPRGRARLAEITGKYSPNNRFSNTSSGQVGCRRGPGARQRQVRWLVNVMRLKFSTHAHPCLTPLSLMLSSLQHAILSISLLVSPLPPARPSLPFRVQRPESNLQQLSKSGMTDKLIFSSWVYIPGIWAADLAPNKRRVSASCLLNLMFSWPEMNYPVMRIYLYSS